MNTQVLIKKNIDLVEAGYPNLRRTNKWEWNHKVAWLCWLESKMVGQKRNGNGPISEDTVGIVTQPIVGNPGQEINTTFEAIDLINGTTGEIHWLSHGIVTQTFIIPLPADVTGVDNPDLPTATTDFVSYWGDEKSDYLGKLLVFDYGRAGQTLNFESVRWISRVFHSAYFGPNTTPLGMNAAIGKHRAEWCSILGVQVVPFNE